MSILKIARMGHPVLRRAADPVEDPAAPEIRRLIDDMIETVEDLGAAGLAAPQVHVPLRLVLFRVPAERLTGLPHDTAMPFSVLINPRITPLDDTRERGWEGCLSVPGLRGAVPRWIRIRYTGLDRDGGPVDRIAAGFHARVVQHECDHLDGILYPQRMDDLSLLGFAEETLRYPIDIHGGASI
jgi:peptide deformylase